MNVITEFLIPVIKPLILVLLTVKNELTDFYTKITEGKARKVV